MNILAYIKVFLKIDSLIGLIPPKKQTKNEFLFQHQCIPKSIKLNFLHHKKNYLTVTQMTKGKKTI